MQPLQSATVILLLVSIEIKGQSINCGRRLVNHNALITRGFKAYHWPWHAAIYHQNKKSLPEYQCGGTLINANSILTAAHCISKSNKPLAPSKVSVSLGRLNLDVDESSARSLAVAKIFQHPDYNEIDLVNDIAVLRLSTEAAFDNYVQPVCLWSATKTELSEVVGREGTVVGWGVTEIGEASHVLQQAFMPVVHSLKCLASNRQFFGTFLSETNYCAGFRNGTRTCNGDSGGSMTFEENGLFYIRGIVSLGAAIEDKASGEISCDSTHYAIFTDVAQFLPWIDEVATNKECEIKVQCSSTFLRYGYFLCVFHIDVEILEPKCKIIFTESTNTTVTWLSTRGKFDTIPDLSDALNKFENLKVLEVSPGKIKFVERKKLSAFSGIERLYLGYNKISELGSDTFDDLNNLTDLDLSKNELKEIERDLFKEISKLTSIFLYENQLEVLHKDLFRKNNKLKLISVHDNKIKEIHRDTCSELRELEELHISNNQIEILPEGLFRNNPQLKKVSLQNNKITTIETDFQHLSKLVELKLKDNVCIDEDCELRCGKILWNLMCNSSMPFLLPSSDLLPSSYLWPRPK